MIEDKLEHLDPVAYLTASDADRVGQFFVRDWCFCRLVGMGGAFRLRKHHLLSGVVKRSLRKRRPCLRTAAAQRHQRRRAEEAFEPVELRWDPDIDASDIGVAVKGGVVA
jgi:hypothetical protein